MPDPLCRVERKLLPAEKRRTLCQPDSKVSTSTNTTEATSTYKPFHRKLTSIGDRPTKLETATTFAEAGQSAFPIAQLIDKTSAA